MLVLSLEPKTLRGPELKEFRITRHLGNTTPAAVVLLVVQMTLISLVDPVGSKAFMTSSSAIITLPTFLPR